MGQPAWQVSLGARSASAPAEHGPGKSAPQWSLGRMVIGNKVIDHERIHGLAEQPVEMAVAYEIRDGLIRTMWVFGTE